MGAKKQIWNLIVKRKVRMIRRNLMYPRMLALIIEGMVEGKN